MPSFALRRQKRLENASKSGKTATVTSATDWERFLSGSLFTFVCGDDEEIPSKTFQVHAGLVAHASEPLNRLMSNGQMTESIQHSAHLPEVDPQTFVLFTQWLYTGIYRPSPRNLSQDRQMCAFHPKAFCLRCGTLNADRESELWPFCSETCVEKDNSGRESSWRYCTECRGIMHVTKGVKQATCPACENATCDKLGRHGGQAVPDGSTALSGKPTDCAPINTFATMIYNVNSIPHQIFAAKLDTLSPPIAHSNDLACHAKLYCFAQMYMADPLKDICTHMLHRDLMHFEITTDTIGAVVELVSFTYDNTVFDTGMLSGGSELRDLVLRFVIARKSRLAQFHEFDELLVAGGDFVVDLFRGELMMPF